jgi:NTP pyrophosphatase (non-canonical NTP hydrolase)
MTFDEYQKQAITTDAYGGGQQPLGSDAFYNKLLGLCGESGEVADKFKKIFRNNDGKMSDEEKQEIVKELGDVLWYLNAIATYLGVPLESVAAKNIEKLFDRKERNVIKSKGDNR